jgi:hypothetical protein
VSDKSPQEDEIWPEENQTERHKTEATRLAKEQIQRPVALKMRTKRVDGAAETQARLMKSEVAKITLHRENGEESWQLQSQNSDRTKSHKRTGK